MSLSASSSDVPARPSSDGRATRARSADRRRQPRPAAPRAKELTLAAPWTARVGAIRVLFGDGRLRELGPEAERLGGRRVLVVTDPGVRDAGHLAPALESLRAAGVEAAAFDAVASNPTTRHAEATAAAARDFSADLLVGLGGGSPMDCAKAANFLLSRGGRMADHRGSGDGSVPMLPSIGVPTTAGTGSEAQSYALVSDPETHRKMACGDPQARFRTVLLDPALTATVPPRAAAAAGLDAVAHAVESHVARRATPASRDRSRRAWRLLADSLPAIFDGTADGAARAGALLGAHLAGAAIERSMLGAAHACANPLTARFGLEHGDAVSLMLPAVVRFNGPSAGRLYQDLLLATGSPDARDPAARLAERLEELRAATPLTRRLRDAGCRRSDLPALAEAAAGEWTAGFNPRPVTAGDLKAIYAAVL